MPAPHPGHGDHHLGPWVHDHVGHRAPTRARTRVIVAMAAVLGLSAADTGAIGSLAAPLEATFHVGNTELGLLVTVTTLVGAAATLPFGAAADCVNRTRLLQVAVLTWAVATIVSALSVSYAMLLATRTILGVLVAAAGPLVVSLAGDLFPADERGRLFGLVLTGELFGGGFGIVTAGSLSSVAGWRPALAVLSIPALILAWEIHRHFPEPARGGVSVLSKNDTTIPGSREDPDAAGPPVPGTDPRPSDGPHDPGAADQPESTVVALAEREGVTAPEGLDLSGRPPAGLWAAIRLVLRVRTNIALIVASGLGYFFLQGLETFAELYFRARYGLGQSLASVLFVLIAVASIIGVLASGRVADRLLRRGRPTARPLVAGLAFIIAPALFLPGALVGLAVALPLLVVAGAAVGAVNPPLDAARLDVVPPGLWGRAEAVRTAIRSLLQGAAPVTFGVVSSAFGAGRAGLGAGINTGGSQASKAAGHGLSLTFILLSSSLVAAGGILLGARHRYLRDVVAAAGHGADTGRRPDGEPRPGRPRWV